MSLMNEAISREDFERQEKGLPPLKKDKIVRPEPEFPKVDNLIKFDDIPILDFERIVTSAMRRIKNKEGVNFIGYDVTILLKARRRAGRPTKEEEEAGEPQPRILKGWMIEGDFEKLKRQRI
jgi:hypothetical protein